MTCRADVLLGQINLQKGMTGTTNLMSYLDTFMHTGTQTLIDNSQPNARANRSGRRVDAFLIFLQEPPAHKHKIVGTGFRIHKFYDNTVEKPRAAIIASQNISIWPVPRFTSRDVTTCIWMKDGKEVYVVSAYFDITMRSVIPDLLQELLHFCTREKKEVIIGADTNAHSSLWHSSDTNARGEAVEDWILTNNLFVHNNGTQPTFHRADARTIIDVTLTMGHTIRSEVMDWEVTDAVLGSDHYLLQWRIPISTKNDKFVRNWKKGDWLSFQICLDEVCQHRRTSTQTYWKEADLDAATNEFMQDITDCLDKSHPKHKARPRVHGLLHFDAELIRWKKKVKVCLSNFRRLGTEFAWEQFREARRIFKNKIKRAKKIAWKRFCEEAEDPKAVCHVNRVIQGRVNQTLGLMKRNDGSLCSSPEISLIQVVNTHFPGNRLTAPARDDPNRTVNVHSGEASFITEEAATEALHTFGPMKAAGMDEFPPCVFQHFGDDAIKRLVRLFKVSYLLGYVPTLWREAKTIFIPKPGKKDYSEPRAFRPITLSSFMIKIMERIILWHLNEVYFKESPLSDDQHAFRGGRSTETALTQFVTQVEEGLVRRKEYALGVFLDIQGAFDNVSAPAIKRSMRQRGFPEPLIQWYCHYVGHRRLVVNHNGVEVKRHLVRGTPQGGVLSPVIWNLVFESLLAQFREGPVQITGYADDGALMIVGKNPHLMMRHMQRAVQSALDWGEECELHFSPAKTVVVLFTRKYKPVIPQELNMGGVSIPFSDSVRYLGVTLDRKLFWKSHLDAKIKVAKFKLMRIRSAMGKLWGSNPLMMRWLYTGCVRPAVSYAALVWARVCEKQWARLALAKVNRLALLTAGHFRRSTPTAGLEVIMHVRPLDVHIQYEACLALNRTHFTVGADGNHIVHHLIPGGHREYCNTLVEQLDLSLQETDRMTPTHVWVKPYKLDRASFANGKPVKSNLGTFEIYTDGSGLEDRFGSGMVVFKGPADNGNIIERQNFHLGEESSVFQGEVFAIKAAALWMQQQRTLGKTFVLYSDSRAALLAVSNSRVKSKLVLTTQRELSQASELNNVVLRWVKAHVGHPGNESADLLAKDGATEQPVCDDVPKIPESMVKLRFKRAFDIYWQQRWDQRTDCRQTKQWMPRLSKALSFQILGLGRKTISWLVQLITGHNFLKRHEALVNGTADNECRFCMEDEETSFHCIAECPALARPRQEIFGTPFQTTPLQWTIRQVVSFVCETSIDSLLDPANIYGNAE